MLKDAFFSDIAGCSSHSFLQVFKLMNIMNEEHLTRFNLPHMYNMPKKIELALFVMVVDLFFIVQNLVIILFLHYHKIWFLLYKLCISYRQHRDCNPPKYESWRSRKGRSRARSDHWIFTEWIQIPAKIKTRDHNF